MFLVQNNNGADPFFRWAQRSPSDFLCPPLPLLKPCFERLRAASENVPSNLRAAPFTLIQLPALRVTASLSPLWKRFSYESPIRPSQKKIRANLYLLCKPVPSLSGKSVPLLQTLSASYLEQLLVLYLLFLPSSGAVIF